jgi:DNA repair protein SbcD/Mre11
MRQYRFVHAADLHLDSPFRGMLKDAPDTAHRLREATFLAYDAMIDLCIAEQVDALLVAGDIYDGADRSLRAQLRFIDGLRRLEQAGIRAFICHGNHDPLDGWEARLSFPENVVRFGAEVTGASMNPADPESPIVYGISYPTREVRENLVPHFPAPAPGRPAIGLLHANVGTNTGHDPYAPCSVEDLAGTGYSYWALGHVHTRQVLREREPVVVYPGNPQGRHANEPGPRGVYLVALDDSGVTGLDFCAVDVVRWERLAVDISGIDETAATPLDEALMNATNEAVETARIGASGRPLVYRLRFTGRGAAHASIARPGFLADVREQLNEQFGAGDLFAFCEEVGTETTPPVDRETLRQAPDLLGDLLQLIDEVAADPEALEQLRTELEPLYLHQRARRYLGDEALAAVDVRALLADAERMLIDELHDAEAR